MLYEFHNVTVRMSYDTYQALTAGGRDCAIAALDDPETSIAGLDEDIRNELLETGAWDIVELEAMPLNDLHARLLWVAAGQIEGEIDHGDYPVSEITDVPDWIDDDITVGQCRDIVQGGCASGAYMPAVTYHEALKTMSEYGDDVLEYIEDQLGELPSPKQGESWSGMACHYLSIAVELWAQGVCDDIE